MYEYLTCCWVSSTSSQLRRTFACMATGVWLFCRQKVYSRARFYTIQSTQEARGTSLASRDRGVCTMTPGASRLLSDLIAAGGYKIFILLFLSTLFLWKQTLLRT